jgi:hypothetical protein
MTRTLLLLLLLPAMLSAREVHFNKLINPHILLSELKAAGFLFTPNNIICQGTKCILYLDDREAKDPSAIIAAHVYVDLRTQEKVRRDAIVALIKKWKAGTITAQEKDQLILDFLVLWAGL